MAPFVIVLAAVPMLLAFWLVAWLVGELLTGQCLRPSGCD